MKPWLEKFASSAFERSSDTAHDLKTPLNIAVLNLELLMMRMRKISTETEDLKLDTYARAVELELRRIAQIVDSFFVFSIPPKGQPDPSAIDVIPIIAEASKRRIDLAGLPAEWVVECHETRIRELFRLFFEGVSKLPLREIQGVCTQKDAQLSIRVEGMAAEGEFDTTKLFKFYYTDPSGNPELSLASARLIAETYGGELTAHQNEGQVKLDLVLPLGER